MTLLNTLANLGGTWAGTAALWLVDVVSFKDCEGVTDLSLDCDTMAELEVSDHFNTVRVVAKNGPYNNNIIINSQ